MCRISPRFDLASGAKSNLGKIRGSRQVRGLFGEIWVGWGGARGLFWVNWGAGVGGVVESGVNAGPRIGREVESWGNAAL